jgi:hypothetical protein
VAEGRVRLDGADGPEPHERGRAVRVKSEIDFGFAHPADRRLPPGSAVRPG